LCENSTWLQICKKHHPPFQNVKVTLPEYSEAACEQMAKHVLRHLAPVISRALEKENEAAKRMSCPGGVEEAPLSRLDGERSLCDLCSTSIANLHGTCVECKWDFCIDCIMNQTESPIPCLNPECKHKKLQVSHNRSSARPIY